MSCPSDPDLAAAHGAPSAWPEVVAHVTGGCAPCARRWRQLDVEDAHVGAPPAAAPGVRAGTGPGTPVGAGPASPDVLVGRPARPLERPEAAGGARRAYLAGPYEIDVLSHPTRGVLVEVLATEGPAPRGGEARLEGDAGPWTAAQEQGGRFVFPAARAALRRLVVAWPGVTLVVDDLERDPPD